MGRCFLAILIAVGQKLMDPRPLPVASLAELWACWLIGERRELYPVHPYVALAEELSSREE